NCHFEGAQATEKSPYFEGATNRPLNTPPKLRRFLAFGFGMTQPVISTNVVRRNLLFGVVRRGTFTPSSKRNLLLLG
ncbi:MAG: hypothetical protein ACP5QM_07890, partial [Caldisericum sp.]|uniref:hypothetical protein n=1 Tax=Caldisericum sp. TaxID=2499687 RepID=UPI003D14D4FD